LILGLWLSVGSDGKIIMNSKQVAILKEAVLLQHSPGSDLGKPQTTLIIIEGKIA
jgi:hypothetical protein